MEPALEADDGASNAAMSEELVASGEAELPEAEIERLNLENAGEEVLVSRGMELPEAVVEALHLGDCREEVLAGGISTAVEDSVARLAEENRGDASREVKERAENAAREAGERPVNVAGEAEQGAPSNLNGCAEYESRSGHRREREVQLAMQLTGAVEEDAHAVAKSLVGLLSTLKFALSEVTTSSVAHMRVENEAAGQVQDAAVDAAAKGNRFINACLRLNEEMKGMEQLASQIEALKVKVDQVESQANRYLTR